MKKRRVSGEVAGNLRQALSLYNRFSGHDGRVIARLDASKTRGVLTPNKKAVLIVVGTLDFVGYTTRRDGKVESYEHEFSETARPLLATSHDGQNVYILGGEYKFTSRGIVDSRKR